MKKPERSGHFKVFKHSANLTINFEKVCRTLFFTGVHTADSQGESLMLHFSVSAGPQCVLEFILAREVEYGSGEIFVCGLVSGDFPSDNRQYVDEIQFEQPAQQCVGRYGQFQDYQFAPRSQDSQDFTQASLPVLEIAHSECNRDAVKSAILKAKFFTVALLV